MPLSRIHSGALVNLNPSSLWGQISGLDASLKNIGSFTWLSMAEYTSWPQDITIKGISSEVRSQIQSLSLEQTEDCFWPFQQRSQVISTKLGSIYTKLNRSLFPIPRHLLSTMKIFAINQFIYSSPENLIVSRSITT